ncbi:MAG: FAD-binding oxidoreductase [Firmicutes bacterium]|nr:FAD-binding oxidoreductase [Bacillota bacterium]
MKDWQRELAEVLGDRVHFEYNERLLYSHDVGSMPDSMLAPFKVVPDAVAQPVTVEELQKIIALADRYDLPLTPRGAGTSGYGGSMPTRGGITIDFTRMDKIIKVDPEKMEAVVEAGVIWSNLEDELRRQGVALRLYPTSAPGATCAGWVAAGGAGIGSFEYGHIQENVAAVEIVTFTGEVKEASGTDLPLFVGTEGITGLITKVTLKLRPAEKDVVAALAFPDEEHMTAALNTVYERKLPFWHINFGTPEFVKRREEAKEHHVMPKDRPVVLFAYPESREYLQGELEKLAEEFGAQILSTELAEEEWGERFYPMRLKKLGPSLIPSEALVPVDNMDKFLKQVSEEVKGIAVEGTLTSHGEATILAFLTSDERTLAYMLGYTKSLLVKELAEKNGGRPYAMGLFFAHEAERVLGKDLLAKVKAFKAETDPKTLLNPDKVIMGKGKFLPIAMQMAKWGRPITDIAEKVLPKEGKDSKKLPKEVAYAAYACAQCGYCNNVCTLYAGKRTEGSSPRGKWFFLRKYMEGKAELTQEVVDNFLLCTTCKRCDDVCQVNLPIEKLWGKLRGKFVEELNFQTFPGFEMMGAAWDNARNIWAGRMAERDAWVPEDVEIQPEGEIGYWAGCTASYVTTDVAENAVHILKEAGEKFTYLGKDESCCGVPFLMSGQWERWERVMRYNIEQIKKRGIKKLIASCPGCWVTLAHHYKEWAEKLGIDWDVEVVHLSQYTIEKIKEGKLKFKKPVEKILTWHDPCHIGRHGKIYEEPRESIASVPGVKLVEMKHNRENALCCGSVLTRIGATAASDKLGDMRVREANEVGADALVTTCPCCEFQLRAAADAEGTEVTIRDFASIIAEGLGYEVKDPTPVIRYMWSVFEKALNQMTDEGMADMMLELMPQMFDMMPEIMQSAMDKMEKMPNSTKKIMLNLMEKIMPAMMPRMMDQMMPKMLPEVLKLMKKNIPDMPESMEELMPQILPSVMNQLMPAMLPKVLARIKPEMMEAMAERLKAQKSA